MNIINRISDSRRSYPLRLDIHNLSERQIDDLNLPHELRHRHSWWHESNKWRVW